VASGYILHKKYGTGKIYARQFELIPKNP
jgi:hypothetical protein